MKKLAAIIILLFISGKSFSQAPVFCNAWSVLNGGYVSKTALDNNGNFYLAGNYFGPSIIGADTIFSSGREAAIIKYDSTGAVIWVRTTQGSDSTMIQTANGVAVDNWNNVYMIGEASSDTVSFNGALFSNNGNLGTTDSFLAKYDLNGNLSWVKGIRGLDSETGKSVATDASGNIFISGWFYSDSIYFDTLALTHSAISFEEDSYIACFDTSGNIKWAKTIRGSKLEKSMEIQTDASGNVIVAGVTESDSLFVGTDTLIHALDRTNVYLIKLNANGNILWSKIDGGNTGDAHCYAMAVDNAENIYIAGGYNYGNINFGIDTMPLVNNGNNVFLVKYDSMGNETWARHSGGFNANALGVCTDNNNDVYITGGYNNGVIFENDTLLDNGAEDSFLAKYTTTGNLAWTKRIAGFGYEEATTVVVDINLNLYVSGYFGLDTIDFDGHFIYCAPNSNSSGFVGKMCDPTTQIFEITKSKTSLNIYPNPSNGNFTVECNEKIEDLKIRNSLGQVIYQTRPNQNNYAVKLPNKGIYIITVMTNGTILTKKIIVSH